MLRVVILGSATWNASELVPVGMTVREAGLGTMYRLVCSLRCSVRNVLTFLLLLLSIVYIVILLLVLRVVHTLVSRLSPTLMDFCLVRALLARVEVGLLGMMLARLRINWSFLSLGGWLTMFATALCVILTFGRLGLLVLVLVGLLYILML